MRERAPLEAVVFDAGGTLLRLDFEWMSECLAALGTRVTPQALHRGEVEGRRRYDASRARAAGGALGGPGAIEAYFQGMLAGAGVRAELWKPAHERFEERHRGPGLWSRPMEGARETLDALRLTSLRLACVSNSDGRAEQHLAEGGVLEGLELVVDSQVVGIEKPDPRIFQIALAGLGVEAGRALYVGDIRSVDEVGARAAGMRFVLIDPWMDYGDGGARIPSIRELPYWLTAHHDVRAPAHAPRRDP